MSNNYCVYPVQDCGPECSDYQVFIEGRPQPLNTARVSAVPFNRRWPGHQRPLDQTETVNFLSMSMQDDTSLRFEVVLPEPSCAVAVRPRSLGIVPVLSSDGLRVFFTLEHPAYFTLEPYGRRQALHFFVDGQQVYDVCSPDEKLLRFGPGVHEAGIIRLQSNTTLLIEAGAVVYGSIRADDAEHIRIIGQGVLDNSHNTETILYDVPDSDNFADVGNAVREQTVRLEYCRHVLIDGITIRDSLLYNISPYGCDDLTIRNVKVIGSWRYNSDGFDLHNCTNVCIEHCFLRTFDDCICVKGGASDDFIHDGRLYDAERHIRVRDCVLFNDWNKCLEIGAGTRAREISDVIFENCDIIHVSFSALDTLVVHYANVHDIVYRNINIELEDHVCNPCLQMSDADRYTDDGAFRFVLFQAEVANHPEYSAGVAKRGKIHDILVEDIRVWGNYPIHLFVSGFDAQHMVERVTLRKISLNGRPWLDPEALTLCNEYSSDIMIE